MLSQIGCVALPPGLLDRVLAGQPVDEGGQAMFDSHPEVARRILAGIPRLETVAEIVAAQHLGPDELRGLDDEVAAGARLIRIGLMYDSRIRQGMPSARAVGEVRLELDGREDGLARAFEGASTDREDMVVRTVSLDELKTGMVLDEDLFATNDLLLMTQGQEITPAMLERLRNFARGIGIAEPVRVRVPDTAVVPTRA
jgi:hypothetical protein